MNFSDRVKAKKDKGKSDQIEFLKELDKRCSLGKETDKPTYLELPSDLNLGRVILSNLSYYLERWYCWNESQSITETAMRQMLPASHRSLFYEVMSTLNCLVDDSMYFLYEGATTRIIEDLENLVNKNKSVK